MVRNCNPIVGIETQEVGNLLELQFDQLDESCIFKTRLNHKTLAIFNQITLDPMHRENRLLVIYEPVDFKKFKPVALQDIQENH